MPALEKADKIPFGGLLQEIQPCAAKHRESCQARKGAAVRSALRAPRTSWVSRRRPPSIVLLPLVLRERATGLSAPR